MKKGGLIILGVLILFFVIDQNSSSGDYCSYTCLKNFDGIAANAFIFTILSSIIFFITKIWSEKIFNKWWKFAKFAIPTVLVLSALINAGVHHNTAGQWQDIFDIPILITLYGIFVIGSVIQIWRGYRS